VGSSIYIAASGAEARLRQLELVANNLANVNTDGYKADRTTFETFYESALTGQNGERTQGPSGGVYVSTSGAAFDRSSGPVQQTGAPLDVAIEGNGYFVIKTEQGERYSRSGSFTIDAQGQLVSAHGNPVLGKGGPINVSGSNPHILANGDVVADDETVGTLRVVKFGAGRALFKHGNGLFASRQGAKPRDVEELALSERSVEGSNVQPIAEMAYLVVLQRAFDAAIMAMQRDDEATERLIQEISQ
jgi:flagellar basal-body rod protein FlgF